MSEMSKLCEMNEKQEMSEMCEMCGKREISEQQRRCAMFRIFQTIQSENVLQD